MNRIKKGDTVVVTTGKSKSVVGKVLRVYPEKDTVIVQGANLIKKHVKPNQMTQTTGGIISKECPLHISNVALFNPQTNKADRVGFRFIEKDGKQVKVRYFKSSNELVDPI